MQHPQAKLLKQYVTTTSRYHHLAFTLTLIGSDRGIARSQTVFSNITPAIPPVAPVRASSTIMSVSRESTKTLVAKNRGHALQVLSLEKENARLTAEVMKKADLY